MGIVDCATLTMSFVLLRPESYTDDLELAEGLTNGNGLIVFILYCWWLNESPFMSPALVILFHEREKKRLMLWDGCTVVYQCSSTEKGKYSPRFKDHFHVLMYI